MKDLSQSGEVPQMKTVFVLHGPGYELNLHHPNRKQNVNCVALLYPQPQDKEVETVGPLSFLVSSLVKSKTEQNYEA